MRKQLKRFSSLALAAILASSILVGCGGSEDNNGTTPVETTTVDVTKLTADEYYGTANWASTEYEVAKEDHYRNYYEVFVYSYCDSDGDGVGDINGLISKLDYIADMGFNGIWLMPIMQSTTYHKYDVIDYKSIDKQYGTMEDFEKLVEECHKRNINIIIDYVFNHTSSSHEWFKAAREYYVKLEDGKEPNYDDCPYANYYNVVKQEDLKSTNGYSKIFGTNYYYECPFWSGMPDLNLDNPAVRKELEEIADFWIEKGVDGFRLDAIKEYWSGNTTKNVEVLKWFEDYVKSVKSDVYVVGENWSSQASIVDLYASGIESQFNYAYGSSDGVLFTSINQGAGKDFARRLQSTEEKYLEANPNMVDAPFASNHDTGRISGFMAYDEAKTKFAGAMNQIMSGCSFTYYGEEIGMTGSTTQKDENARLAMYWTTSNSSEMCTGPSGQDTSITHNFGSLEEQQKDKDSVNWYYKKMLHLRKTYEEIAKGKTTSIQDLEEKALCILKKTYNDSSVIVVANFRNEEKTVEFSKSTYGYEGIADTLTIKSTDKVTLDGDTLTVPAYGIVILK